MTSCQLTSPGIKLEQKEPMTDDPNAVMNDRILGNRLALRDPETGEPLDGRATVEEFNQALVNRYAPTPDREDDQ